MRSLANRARSLAFAFLTLVAAHGAPALAGDGAATPSASTDCEVVRIAYASVIAEARACDPAKADSCSAFRPAALEDVCRCAVAVNPAAIARLDQLVEEYRSKGCVKPGICNRLCKQPDASCSGAPASCH